MRSLTVFQRLAYFALASSIVAVAACSGTQTFAPQQTRMGGNAFARMRDGGLKAQPCSSYKLYKGSGGVKTTFTDSSGLKPADNFFIYVDFGAGSYLNSATGAIANFPTTGKTPLTNYEYPLSCYLAGTKTPFILPPATSARVYVTFGGLTLYPTSGAVQPVCCEPPNKPAGYKNPNYSQLWDYFEYHLASGSFNIDSSEVDAFALPFVITVNKQKVGTASYAAIMKAFKNAAQPYSALLVPGSAARGIAYYRVMSENDATTQYAPNQPFSAFPVNYFYSSKFYPSNAGGYLGAVLKYYSTGNTKGSANYHKFVFVAYQTYVNTAQNGVTACNGYPPQNGANCPTYYAYSDGTANFKFVLASAAKTPPPSGATPYPTWPPAVTVPVKYFQEVNAPLCNTCGGFQNGVWSAGTFAPPGTLPGTEIPFYMFKQLGVDLFRGVAMQTGYHSVAPCSTAARPPKGCQPWNGAASIPVGNNYYQAKNLVNGTPALFSMYAKILHANFLNNSAYASAYDDLWSQSTDIGVAPSTPMNVTISSMSCGACAQGPR